MKHPVIVTIFGKKGSGKTTLARELMYRIGGRVVFLSPVERVDHDYNAWSNDEIHERMHTLKHGEVILVGRADTEAFDIIALTAMTYRDYTIVIDEVDRYFGSDELLDLIHYSRHSRISIISNTRRFTDVPRLMTAQSDYLCIFRTNEPRDMEYFRKYAGLTNDHILADLPSFTYYVYPTEQRFQTNPGI